MLFFMAGLHFYETILARVADGHRGLGISAQVKA